MNIGNSLEREKCCGCTACVSVCPRNCITMEDDEKGFLRPRINMSKCVDCGKCVKVCPSINLKCERLPIKVWAVKNSDDKVRANSSSGGTFMALSEWIIQHGGVVFGARFNEKWEIEHGYADTIEGVKAFQGSKYVQSNMGDCYLQVRHFLEDDKWVLFTGTQCQIEGLINFVGANVEKLLTVDVICHGVPSPRLWQDYLDYLRQEKFIGKENEVKDIAKIAEPLIEKISFRDKTFGWKRFSMLFKYRTFTDGANVTESTLIRDGCKVYHPICGSEEEDLYYKGFIRGYFNRPSCYDCPSKNGRSHSDITIGDYWGLPEELLQWDDDRGISVVMVFTEKGNAILDELKVEKKETSFVKATRYNPNYAKSCAHSNFVDMFWRLYPKKGFEAVEVCAGKQDPSIFYKALRKIYHRIRKFIKK